MDHSVAPLLDAMADYHARDRYGFTPPGHRQGRGADPRTRGVIGEDAFRSDLLATAGLDDRKSSHGYLSKAEELMARCRRRRAGLLLHVRQLPFGEGRDARRDRPPG